MNDRERRVLWWRLAKSNVAMSLTLVATAITVVPLVLVIWFVVGKGWPGLTLAFFTHLPAPVGQSGGGMVNAIAGTLEMVTLASIAAIPIGIAAGIFAAEYGKRRLSGRGVRFAADLLAGMPSIVIGIFVYGIVVRPMHGFSGMAGAFALAVMIIPVVAITTEEMMLLVPNELREAGLALGINRWRVISQIGLRTALSGIMTGVVLAVARVAGETAPLLFTALGNRFWSISLRQPMASLPAQIYTYAVSPFRDWQQQAWTGALVLMLMVLALELGVRSYGGANPRK